MYRQLLPEGKLVEGVVVVVFVIRKRHAGDMLSLPSLALES